MKNPNPSSSSNFSQASSSLRYRRRMTEPTRNWVELPPNLTANILHRLGAIAILVSAQKVCTAWRKICKDLAMWRVIDMWNLGDLHAIPYDLDKMCRHAVDRSQGQLIDINIEYFGDVELLDYIVHRSSQLRCLQISCCYGSYYEGFGAAVKKLQLLEELCLNLTEISEEDIEVVERSCPTLKSFKLNTQWYQFSDMDDINAEYSLSDNEALAIAKSMPQLLHVQLIGNQITDKGLKAILDGCTHLESLEPRLCNNLKLEGNLGKRCSVQIKDLKWPKDSTKGCLFAFGGVADSYGDNDYHHFGIAGRGHYGDDDSSDEYDSDEDDEEGDGDDSDWMF